MATGAATTTTPPPTAALAADAHMTVHEQEEATPISAMPQLLGVVMPASGLPLTCSLQHTEADKERVERPMPWPSFACDCQRLISMQPQQIPQDTQPWSRNAFNPDHLGEMAGANESLVCSFVSHTITACCQMMDVEHTPHLHDAWNMVEGINSWPAKSLLLEIVLGVHISWRWHLLKDGIDPCRSGRHELVSVHASLVNALDRNLMLPWDPGGSRYVCWVLNNKQFAGIIKVSFMNMLLDLNGNALVDAMADIGKLSTFIQLAQQSVNLLVINELGNCTFVLLYAMSTFTTYLGNSGIGVARHVFNNMPAWRRNAFSPGHSAIRGDHLLLESIQSRGRSPFSLSQYGIGGVQYVVDKLPSSSRNAFNLGNSVMQASPAMWFSFFSQCHTTQFSARNWDPGIALTKSKEQLTILILQWFRFSTWLMLLWGGWPNGGRNYSLYQLLGHNLSLTEQPQLHMIGVVGPTKERDSSNSAMTATSMRLTHITNWLVQMEIKCPNHILRFSQLLANGILLLLFFLVILKAEFKAASHNDWSYTPSPIPEHIVIKFTHHASNSSGISRDVGNTTFKLQFYILMIDDP